MKLKELEKEIEREEKMSYSQMKNERSEDERVGVDPLKYLYFKYRDALLKEEDVLSIDITPDFEEFIDDKIENKELINIAIVGEVSGSKSTSAIALMHKINTCIEKKYKKVLDRFKHIFSDQTEFLRFINTDEQNACIVIDEFSRMAETGFNATTEIALFNYYSDVFAQKYIHRISCSPSIVMDANSNIILTYLGKDVIKKISKFSVEYRSPSEGFRKITLGHITVDVGTIIDKDYYKAYRKKKFERMDLLDKHGVRDIRELEFSEITLATYEELESISSDTNKGDMGDMILATISRVMRERKRIYSSMTTTEIMSRCKNLLSLKKTIIATKRKLYKLNESKKESEELIAESIRKSLIKQSEILEKELNEEKRKFEIYKQFLNI